MLLGNLKTRNAFKKLQFLKITLVIFVLTLYTIAMLKRGNDKTYRLYKKDKKSFAKAPYRAKFTASQLRGYYVQIKHPNTHKFSQPITRTRANSRLCAFFISHRLINRKERKELSFAQLHKGIIGMSYGLRQVNSMDNV